MSKYILLEGRGKDPDAYIDTLVSLHRLSATPRVVKTASSLGFKVRNTAHEQDKTPYIGDINHREAVLLVIGLGGRMLTSSQGLDLLDDLKNKKAHYDELGRKLPQEAAKKLYDEIAGVREPWRGEHLADRVFQIDNNLLIATNYVMQNRVLVPQQFHLLTSKQEEILAKRAKKHGLEYYNYEYDSVAGFNADSGRAGINCDWGPDSHGASLGVRCARKKLV